MVGDLLGQVVADAGDRERAALLLGIKPSWPIAWVARIDGEHDFDDLAAAVLRGQIDGAEGCSAPPPLQHPPRQLG